MSHKFQLHESSLCNLFISLSFRYVHVLIMGWMVMLWPWAFMVLGVCDLYIVGAVAFSSVQF
jgi:hypothetical protein